jgi:signal transduction histidine kinase
VERLTKIERSGAVAAAAAHDINNELTVILSTVTDSIEKLGLTHPARPLLLELRSSAQRCAWMTSDLLNYSARHGVRPTSERLENLLRA